MTTEQHQLTQYTAFKSWLDERNKEYMENEKSILSRLETLVPPPYPASEKLRSEVFDYRASKGAPNPANKLDTFIFDILIVAKNYGITEGAWYVLKLYQDVKGYEVLGGYKAWTHWNFVNSITERSELWKLGEEVESILKSGRNWKKEHYELLGCPELYVDESPVPNNTQLADRFSVV